MSAAFHRDRLPPDAPISVFIEKPFAIETFLDTIAAHAPNGDATRRRRLRRNQPGASALTRLVPADPRRATAAVDGAQPFGRDAEGIELRAHARSEQPERLRVDGPLTVALRGVRYRPDARAVDDLR